MQLKKAPKRIVQFVLRPVRPLFDSRVYKMRSGPARGLKRKGGFAFMPSPPSKEEQFFATLDLDGAVVYDIGANIGVMSLFFARKVGRTGRVYAFEPNPDTLPVLRENLRINAYQNVAVFDVGIGHTRETGDLVVHRGRRGSGSIDADIVRRFREAGSYQCYRVNIFPLDEYVHEQGLRHPNFIKIDTEGYEYPSILGMRRILKAYSPDLYIEMHGATEDDKIENARKVVDILVYFGYRIFNVEREVHVGIDNYEEASRGHLYCTTG